MCHYMLPGASQNPSPDSPPGLYAEGAVQWFLEAISNAGTVPGDYVAKLFGGGRMFGSNTPNAEPAGYGLDICDRNIACGRELLQEKGFKVAAEDVGGAGSREVLFEIWSGDAWVCRGPELAV
jgi:chemotaxis protein CheD